MVSPIESLRSPSRNQKQPPHQGDTDRTKDYKQFEIRATCGQFRISYDVAPVHIRRSRWFCRLITMSYKGSRTLLPFAVPKRSKLRKRGSKAGDFSPGHGTSLHTGTYQPTERNAT
jgi:hypothetical protein